MQRTANRAAADAFKPTDVLRYGNSDKLSFGLRSGYNSSSMPTRSERDRILEALQDLPPDATFDDAIERLVFLAKIDAGLKELDAGKGIPHDEVKRRLGL
jgi:hypothetical protein